MRTIDADDAIKRIRKLWTKECPLEEVYHDEDYAWGLLDAIDAVDDSPTIEPKRGEWVKRTHNTLIAQVNFAYCSECGQPIMHEHTRPLWNFCPNCGARMKGADDE